jgi:hypothetical protein
MSWVDHHDFPSIAATAFDLFGRFREGDLRPAILADETLHRCAPATTPSL